MKKFFGGLILGGILSPLLILGAALLYVKVLSIQRGGDSGLTPPVLPMTEADYDWTVETVAGDPVAFEDFRGEVVFLTFFKPGCGTCQAELPHIQALYEELESEVTFAMVAVSKTDDWLGYMEEHAVTFPIYIATNGYPDLYHTGHVPSTFILDRNGRVAARFKGAAAWDDASAVTFLRGLAVAESQPLMQEED